MRTFLILVFGFSSMVAAAQPTAPAQSASPTGWDAVRTLSPGSSLDIKLHKGGEKCIFRLADADSLTCQHSGSLTLQRVDIIQIKVHHRGRSTLAGLAIGAAAGAATGFASGGSGSWRALGTVVLAFPGGAAGALTGYFTDFTRSVVYKAP